jgi:hypothetical protein
MITKSPSALRTKRKRVFKGHAKPLQFKAYKDMDFGENVQIDHMTVTKNGRVFKHFQAWDRKSKFIYTQIYTKATSGSAAKFMGQPQWSIFARVRLSQGSLKVHELIHSLRFFMRRP